jgi:hypothetical protein
MQFKTINKLFKGMYQYKIVLVCAGANWFRSGDWDGALNNLKKVDIKSSESKVNNMGWRSGIKTQEDLDYAFKLQAKLKKLKEIEVRVETPWITVYTNLKANVDALIRIDNEKVKYVCIPPDNTVLAENTIIMPKMPYDFRITVGKTIQNHDAFIGWAEQNSKLKLTKACKRELSKDHSWGGTHFYVTGDNNLLMTKMHLGGSINKVERIIKA